MSSSRSSVSATRRFQKAPNRSPNATPVPLMSAVNKRLSSGIPKAASRLENTRRQSSVPFVTHREWQRRTRQLEHTCTRAGADASSRHSSPRCLVPSDREQCRNNYVSDQSEKYGANMMSTPARLIPKTPQKTPPPLPNGVAKSPRPKSVAASPGKVKSSPRSVQQKGTPPSNILASKHPRRQSRACPEYLGHLKASSTRRARHFLRILPLASTRNSLHSRRKCPLMAIHRFGTVTICHLTW